MTSKVVEIDITGNVRNKINVPLTIEEVYYSLTELDKNFSKKMILHLNLRLYARKLQERAHFVVCRDKDNIIVGIVAYYLNNEKSMVYIPLVCVDSNKRRVGIARNMMQVLIELVAGSYKTIELEVRDTNVGAISLYQKMGFVKNEAKTDDKPKLYMIWRRKENG